MPITFPSSPATNDVYSSGGKSWQWTGTTWDALGTQTLGSNRNVIINGGFDIWQRGTSIAIAENSFSADRWTVNLAGGTPSGTFSQQVFTPGTAPVSGYEGTYFLRYAHTSLNGAVAIEFNTRLEDVRTLAGQTATLSFWAKSSTSNTLNAIFLRQNFGSGGSATTDVTPATSLALTTSWQRYSYTVSVPSIAGKTIGTGSRLDVRFSMPLTAVANVDLWGMQLEAGPVATQFNRHAPSIQGELAACQRYFTSSFPIGITPGNKTSPTISNGNELSNYSTTVSNSYSTMKSFPVPMRIGPAISIFNVENGASGTWSVYNSGSKIGDAAPASVDISSRGFLTYFSGSTITVSNGGWSASAEF